MSSSLRPCGLELIRLVPLWDSPGKNPGVGSHALFQEIFPAQGLNPSLMCPILAGEFFTTSSTWETHEVLQFSSVQLLSRVRLFVTP